MDKMDKEDQLRLAELIKTIRITIAVSTTGCKRVISILC